MSKFLESDRRTFLRRGAMGAGALWVCALPEFAARRAYGSPQVSSTPYGPISPKLDEATGLPLLQLPDGFRYLSYGWTGDLMTDGVRTPNLHDGMAVVDELHGRRLEHADDGSAISGAVNASDHGFRRLVLVRNHETASGTPFANNPAITYLPDGAGGTSNLLFNPQDGQFERAWSSLAGTVRNCAGSVTPWGSWLTCEETDVVGHGWTFEVGPVAGDPTPLKDMGRFSHEAGMVDPKTGYVYQTEDSGDSGFYKFVPFSRRRLADGGTLYMLALRNQPQANLGGGFPHGTRWDLSWVRIDDPEAATMSTFAQGFAKGGARFSRLEGAWWGDRTGYFLSTNGGSVGEGQVFEYDPRAETLTLIYDAPDANALDNPDNITVTPRGGLLLCEDAAGNNFLAGERLIGLTFDGQTFTFAQNNINLTAEQIAGAGKTIAPGNYTQAEWAGACYSPDGQWLFVNIQTPGITFAITGPWGGGPL
jgi:uncharacterized repeat protein (TIGR03803 family)